jgi:hypothetical protein
MKNPIESRRDATSPQARAGPAGMEAILFGSHKIKIEGDLLKKAQKCAEACGYESVDEFVLHVLEKEIKKVLPPDEDAPSKEVVKKRLQGLGYIE